MKSVISYTGRRLPFGIDPNHNYTLEEAAELVFRCEPRALEEATLSCFGPHYLSLEIPESEELVEDYDKVQRILYPGSFLIEYMESRIPVEVRGGWMNLKY